MRWFIAILMKGASTAEPELVQAGYQLIEKLELLGSIWNEIRQQNKMMVERKLIGFL